MDGLAGLELSRYHDHVMPLSDVIPLPILLRDNTSNDSDGSDKGADESEGRPTADQLILFL